MYFVKKLVGLLFGQFFHKLIWLPLPPGQHENPEPFLPHQVHQCLVELLSACLQYCRLTLNDAAAAADRSEMLSALSTNFSRQSGLLFKLLTSIRSRQTGSQVPTLLNSISTGKLTAQFLSWTTSLFAVSLFFNARAFFQC
jgi:hypothetical protein